MGNKLGAFLIGLVICGGILLTITLVMTRPSQPITTSQEKAVSATDLKEAQDLTTGMQNFGDLPYKVGSDQVGRSNPFESY
jgi:hypothetical protein